MAELEAKTDGDDLTIEQVKDFLQQAKKKRADFLTIADRSWREIEKRNHKGRLYGGNDLDRRRRYTRFPLWWSCWKIRQPIVFARLPLPIIKDTQGDDPYGRTACVIGERLTRGILKTFDAFSEFQSSVDDFLVTNFGWGRVFYKVETCDEPEKMRLQEMQIPAPEQVDEQGQPIPSEPIIVYVDPQGQIVEKPLFDEFGAYLLTGNNIEVDNEEVYFCSGMFSALYVDPHAKKWNQSTRIAFEYEYGFREFKQKFGTKALDTLELKDIEEAKDGKPIIVLEYHDKFLKQVRWFAECGKDFFQPAEMQGVSIGEIKEIDGPDYAGDMDHSDLYELSGFFPCAEPMIVNSSSKEFWPIPEYFQVADIIDDIHQIVDRMVLLTKAIRVRFFFDESVPQLKSLIGETGEGSGIGIPNLEQALMNSKGDLSTLVAYLPIDEMIKGLTNMYAAFQQRLDMFYQITGISDLIRGQTNPDSDKTFGERQMEGRFALNRVEPYQRKVQEWIKDNYLLLMELALKRFSPKSLDEYIVPQTLDPEDKQRYEISLELLKANKRRRFRIDFETDSTIAINQEWRKKNAIELANALTKAMESVAQVAETQPELAGTELKVLKHMIGELFDGKLFIDEIQDSISQVVERVSAPKEEGPNPDMIKAQIESEKLNLEREKLAVSTQLQQLTMESTERIKIAEMQQAERFEALKSQIEQIKIGNESGIAIQELNQKAAQLQADIALANAQLESKRNEIFLKAQELADKSEMKAIEVALDARVQEHKKQLDELYFSLEKEKTILVEKEKMMTEMRLQDEHKLQTFETLASLQKTMAEIGQDIKAPKPEKPLNITVEAPKDLFKDLQPKATPAPPAPRRPRKIKSKVVRDQNGELLEVLHEEELDDD